MFGHWELIVLLVVVLLIFGPSQLPKLAKGIGKSIQSFKAGIKDTQEKDVQEEDRTPPQVAAGEPQKELPGKAGGDG